MRFYSSESLGPKQTVTPEGFLVCHDVAIARTGSQLYSTDELPDMTGVGGRVTIQRDADDVFHADTLASFEGKPVTIDHPDEEVGPGNWRQLAVGHVQHVRRGEGIDSDLLFADLLITDQTGIDTIRVDGIKQVSCGYDAEYEQTAPGFGRQHQIIGNHVALVERGRAGSRCSIQDSEHSMTKQVPKSKFLDRLAVALGFKDADELEKKFDDAEETAEAKADREAKETKDSIAALQKTVDSLVKSLSKDTDEETDEEKAAKEKATADTVIEAEIGTQAELGTLFTGDAFNDAVARAEIIAPGFKALTTDAEAMTEGRYMQQALSAALKTPEGAAAITPLLTGRTVKQMTGDSLRSTFVAASEIMKAQNNAAIVTGARTHDAGTKSPKSIADINAAAAAYWKR